MKNRFRRALAAALLCTLPAFFLSCASKEPERPTEGVGVATLSAVGDIALSQDMLADAHTAAGSYDFVPLFSEVVTTISRADLAIGNLEGTFASTDEGSYPDSLAQALAVTGFDLLQTANSYSVFNGLSGLERTKSVIEQNQMTALGTYTSPEERSAEQVILKEVNGIRFAFVAFTKGFQGMSLPKDSEYCTNLLYTDYATDYEDVNTQGILSVLEAAKQAQPDFIIAALHWGSENITEISATQEDIADLLLSNGVDVILGSHSHRVGEVEQRQITLEDGQTKDCVIAYSLGDFCMTEAGNCSTSILLELEFTRDHSSGAASISKVDYVPVSTVDNGADRAQRFAVVPTNEAIALYEGNYYLRVSDEAYALMVEDLKDLDEDVYPPKENE